MKKQLLKFSALFTLCFLISCSNKKETEFIKTLVSQNYEMEIPSRFEKTDESHWKLEPHTYLDVSEISGTTEDIKSDIEILIQFYDTQDIYQGKTFIKTENFEHNGFKGIINYYEKDNKGKGAGLVTLKSYIVFAVVQDEKNRIYINSISLNKNINDDLSESIKSLRKSESKKEKIVSSFDEAKAIKDGFQIFKKDNFIIKCNGKLLLDKLRIEQMQQNGQTNNSRPFHVFYKGVDYNINISDFSSLLKGQGDNEIAKYNNEDLTYYQTKFDEMEIKNQRKKFKNFDAVYYENKQEGKLSKAVIFHDKMKSYMLQVTSKNNSNKLFEDFTNSFELIEK